MQVMQETTYELPASVVQLIVGTLNQIPTVQGRVPLNVIENICSEQDRKRAEKADEERIAAAVDKARGTWSDAKPA